MNLRPFMFLGVSLLASTSLLPGGDLSSYREFHLGAPLADVAKQAGMDSSDIKSISSRPEHIEELDWRTERPASGASRPDSVREIRFRFYNRGLFEMMVAYDSGQTNGLTDADMTEALSAIYGPASVPVVKEMAFNSGYSTTVRVVSQWSDAENLVSLVGFAYGGGFGVVVSSKGNQALARLAIAESERLDRAEAPQRELAERAKQAADAEARDEKSRLLNKPGFRP
jgi:hypothetical protein